MSDLFYMQVLSVSKTLLMLTQRCSDSLCSATWSELPVELLKEIFLFVTVTSTRDALILRLVSRYFNSFILPVLFQHVCLRSTEEILHFVAIISPKRKLVIPASKSHLHTAPRALDLYSIASLALTTTDRRPSTETALESIAPVFATVKCLAITAQNLSSHAFWMRKQHIRPEKVMLIHFGRPGRVNFHEPVFSNTTHLFTSVLFDGLRDSTIEDLPCLTHLAAYTRTQLPAVSIQKVVNMLQDVLTRLPNLQRLVLVLDDSECDIQSHLRWSVLKQFTADSRFILLPFFRGTIVEWEEMVTGDDDVWSQAEEWSKMTSSHHYALQLECSAHKNVSPKLYRWLLSKGTWNWDVDMIERDGYREYVADPARRRKKLYSLLSLF